MSTTEPRRYLAIHLDGGHTVSGNPRRGWLVYLDTPETPLLGWVEEGYMGDAALYIAIPCAELNWSDKAVRANFADRNLRKSGRVRFISSISVPFAAVRNARRKPFALPA